MATDLSLEVQEAIYAILAADVPLAVFVADRIFDGVQDDVTFPYLSTPPFDSELNRFKDGMGQSHDVVIDIWSRDPDEGSTIECRNIIEAIYDIFETGTSNTGNRSGLTLSSGTISLVQISGSRLIRETDRRTVHGIVNINVRTRS